MTFYRLATVGPNTYNRTHRRHETTNRSTRPRLVPELTCPRTRSTRRSGASRNRARSRCGPPASAPSTHPRGPPATARRARPLSPRSAPTTDPRHPRRERARSTGKRRWGSPPRTQTPERPARFAESTCARRARPPRRGRRSPGTPPPKRTRPPTMDSLPRLLLRRHRRELPYRAADVADGREERASRVHR